MKLFGKGKQSPDQSVPGPPSPVPEEPWFGVRFLPDGDVQARWRSAEEAKQCIAELKLKKRELQITKKAVQADEHQARAAYTDKTRRRSPAMRGGGSVGKVVRSVQSSSRASDRRHLAQQIAPLEGQKAAVEDQLLAIDRLILQYRGKGGDRIVRAG